MNQSSLDEFGIFQVSRCRTCFCATRKKANKQKTAQKKTKTNKQNNKKTQNKTEQNVKLYVKNLPKKPNLITDYFSCVLK